MTRALDGRVALVTGAGRGIGRGLALALADSGARVATVDIDERSTSETASAIAESGGEALALRCDVSDRDNVQATVGRVVEHFGALSILGQQRASIATRGSPGRSHGRRRCTLALDSGFWGTFHCMQAAFVHLRESGDGRIVNLGSSAGTHGQAGLAGYAAAKEAIRGLSRVAARASGGSSALPSM